MHDAGWKIVRTSSDEVVRPVAPAVDLRHVDERIRRFLVAPLREQRPGQLED